MPSFIPGFARRSRRFGSTALIIGVSVGPITGACSTVESQVDSAPTTWVPFESPIDPANDMHQQYYEIYVALDEALGERQYLVGEMFERYSWNDVDLRDVAARYPKASGDPWAGVDFVSYLSLGFCVDVGEQPGEWPRLLSSLTSDFATAPHPGLDAPLMAEAVVAVAATGCRDLLMAEGVIWEVAASDQRAAERSDPSRDLDHGVPAAATTIPNAVSADKLESDTVTPDPIDPVAQLETSAPADDIAYVAERILDAIVRSDNDELERWATFSMPTKQLRDVDLVSLSCEVSAGRCNVLVDSGRSAVLGFDYGDRGWSGWSFSIDGEDPDVGAGDHCDVFNAAGACLISVDGLESCGVLGDDVFGDDESGYCPEVTRIQASLVALGMSVDIDGYYGLGTQQAVLNYQRFNGLEPDGLVGPRTWMSLSVHEPTS